MKKKTFRIVAVALVLMILSGILYLKIWGGKPELEHFEVVAGSYEALAELALDTYSEMAPDKEYIVLDIYYGTLRYNGSDIQLNDEQKKAVIVVGEEFNYLRICKDAVFFHEDETGYYGLVYSKNPIVALYKEELPQRGRDYHRINSRWYEWGVFGL